VIRFMRSLGTGLAARLRRTLSGDVSNRTVIVLLIGIALLASIGSLIINLTADESTPALWSEGWLQNFSTEMFGAFLTFILIELIVGGREKRAEKEANRIEQQAAAIVELKATHSSEERQFILDKMKQTDLLYGADLQGINLQRMRLEGANLRGADLRNAVLTEAGLRRAVLVDTNLQGAYLVSANLQNADLSGSNLQRSHLDGANLAGAKLATCNLWGASFQRANLTYVDLRRANLRWGVNLRAANMQAANLRDADLGYAILSDNTTLPDSGTWTPDADMKRFTNRRHPNFWEADRFSPTHQ
jgi:hypothetical protein